jgi:hypothetical protein
MKGEEASSMAIFWLVRELEEAFTQDTCQHLIGTYVFSSLYAGSGSGLTHE